MPTPLDAAYLTALGLGWPWLVVRRKRRRDLQAKFTGAIQVPPASGPRVWFHGVSVGEIHLLRVVLERFRRHRPDCDAIVSSTTETGLDEAEKTFPELPIIPWPLDFSWAVRRAIAEVRPDLIVLAESELWPGMLAAANAARVPVVVINGRLSPKSAQNYQRFAPLTRLCLNRVACFAVQTPEYAGYLLNLGVPANRISVTGSVKFDGAETNRNNSKTNALRELFAIHPGQTVWVAGSTQEPEEADCLRIYQRLRQANPTLRFILVPRQKDRFDDVADLLKKTGLPFVRRSQLGERPASSNDVILVDTIGELRAVWGLADIAMVGGSFDGRRGGQNMIEPAGYGAAVVFGPHVWNFRATVEQLLAAGGAVQVNDFTSLEAAINRLLEMNERDRLGRKAQEFVMSQQGATERTLDVLDRFLPAKIGFAAA